MHMCVNAKEGKNWWIAEAFFDACNVVLVLYTSPPLGVATWAMVNTHYMVDGHPIHDKDPYNGYYKSLWTIGWLAPINGY